MKKTLNYQGVSAPCGHSSPTLSTAADSLDTGKPDTQSPQARSLLPTSPTCRPRTSPLPGPLSDVCRSPTSAGARGGEGRTLLVGQSQEPCFQPCHPIPLPVPQCPLSHQPHAPITSSCVQHSTRDKLPQLSVGGAQSCPTLCGPTDCSPPASSVPWVSQARTPEWVAISFSRGPPDPGTEPGSPALQADSSPSEPPGEHSWVAHNPSPTLHVT